MTFCDFFHILVIRLLGQVTEMYRRRNEDVPLQLGLMSLQQLRRHHDQLRNSELSKANASSSTTFQSATAGAASASASAGPTPTVTAQSPDVTKSNEVNSNEKNQEPVTENKDKASADAVKADAGKLSPNMSAQKEYTEISLTDTGDA